MHRPSNDEQSLVVPGVKTDASFIAQYESFSTWGHDVAKMRSGRVSHLSIGEHDGFYVINRRIKATFEHPFLVRRGDAWGFCSVELLQVGDCLVTPTADGFGEERIDTLERIDGRVRTVAIRVPGTNTYLAEGVWTHNDLSSSSGPILTDITHSSSSSSSGSSSGSKSSGSSFSSSSGSISATFIGSSSGGTPSGSGTGFTHQSTRSHSGGGGTFGNSAGSSGGNTFGEHKG